MTIRERIVLLRRSILFSKLYKKDGSRRSHIEIIETLLSRCAIQDTFIQDRKLEGEFSEWSNEILLQDKTDEEN
ncbi:hypothetical protein [Leptospira mayottensis]|uniref:Uncharacterized protein n=1 Tax=Leptospira mayottensis TaxID=1137606 RepID=A0ABN5NUR1_9LEPT|nr:hypothetical protein [Leptospira mayottensis]AXR64533.1 hypothetical protein DQM28_10170 [Leptospira mayottensis]